MVLLDFSNVMVPERFPYSTVWRYKAGNDCIWRAQISERLLRESLWIQTSRFTHHSHCPYCLSNFLCIYICLLYSQAKFSKEVNACTSVSVSKFWITISRLILPSCIMCITLKENSSYISMFLTNKTLFTCQSPQMNRLPAP